MWICKNCANNNEDAFAFCNNCGSKKPDEHKEPQDTSWTCEKCGCKNDSSYRFCSNCGSKAETEDNSWVCRSCGKTNKGNYAFCSRCGSAVVKIDPLPPVPFYVWIGAATILCLLAVIIYMNMSLKPVPRIEEPAITPAIVYIEQVPEYTPVPVPSYSPAPQTPEPTPVPAPSYSPAPQTPKPTPVPTPSYSQSYQAPVVHTNPIKGYNMVVYVTQSAEYPHPRMFRNFSIANSLGACGGRESYGEKHFEIQITPEQLAAAKAYGPGEFVPNIGEQYVGGVNVTQETAYVITVGLDNQGRYYPMFIKSEIR